MFSHTLRTLRRPSNIAATAANFRSLSYMPCFPIPEVSRSWISGAYHDQVSGPTYDNYAPATGAKISTVQEATQDTVDAAVAAAKAAFPSWSALSGAERGRILTRAAHLIREYNSDLHLLESVDAGIPVSETEFVQVLCGADAFEVSR